MRFPGKQKIDALLIVTDIIMLIGNGMGMEHQEMLCIHDKIAESNPYKVSLSSQHKGMNKKQAATSAEYSNIRIHPVFVNVDSSTQSYIQASNGPLFNSIRTLADVLMVRPVQGNIVIPPMCSGYTSGLNEGKCQAPLQSQNNNRCGPFGVIPTDYIGTREVCATSSQDECIEDGLDGPGINDTDYLLFVSAASNKRKLQGCICSVSLNSRIQQKFPGKLSPNSAPRNLRSINETSTTVTFQWDALVLSQSNNNITWYVITCSSLEDNTIITRNITGDNTVGTVTGLRPFTSYECSIHAVTKYGGPHSYYITVETLEGVPSAPVITAVTAIDSQSVLVTWRIPAEPNGVITGYTITYNTEGFLNFTVNVTFNGKPTQSFNITGLSTYQLVVVTITAINGAGRSSPSNQVSNRTMELAPGVVEFHVNNLTASSEAEVSWSPPLQPNGVITSYQVIYSVYESSTITTSEMLSNTINTYIIRNLVPGIPYQVTVVAFTIAGRGTLNDYIVFFSEEHMPERFPSNISYTRLNETIINVTWTPMSLSEAQGFPLYQVIPSEPSTNNDTSIDVVVTNSSFVIFANLSIDQQHSLVVGVSTGSNRSVFVYSDPIIVPRLTGGHSGAAVIGRAIGRIVLIAILIVIISNKQMKR